MGQHPEAEREVALRALLLRLCLRVFLGAIVLAFTFGTMGYDGFATIDDIMKAGKHQDLYGFLGGVVFNLANMLLVAAISVAGLSVAFPIAIGLALVIGVVLNYVIDPGGNPLLVFGGAGWW